MKTRPPRSLRYASVFMAGSALFSLLALAGWLFNLPILGSLNSAYIPMAPATSLLFLGTCLVWLVRRLFPDRPALHKSARFGLLGLSLLFVVLAFKTITSFGFDLEKLLYANPPLFERILTARMSPLTAAGFLLAVLAMLFLDSARPGTLRFKTAAALALALFILSGLICLGYVFREPFFYGGTLTPVALTTALAFWLLSLGLLLTAGPSSWPLSNFIGSSLKARLQRAFIPITLFIVLLQGLLSTLPDPWTVNPAIKVGVAALVASIIVVLSISIIAHSLDAELERGRLAELAQQHSEFLFRALFEASPDSVMLIDPHDQAGSWPIMDCNEAACWMNGYRRDELIGHSIDLLNLTPGSPVERREYLEQLRSLGSLKLETYHRRKDGSTFPIEVSTTLVQVTGRELVIGIDRDITDRRQAEEQLKTTERIYRQAITRAGGVPYQLEYNHENYIFLGEGFESLTGYPPAEMTGPLFNSRLRRVESFGEYQNLPHAERIRMARQGDLSEWREDYLFERKDGSLVWLADHSIQLNDAAGNPTGSLGILMDISGRKQAEAEQRKSEAQLRALFASMQDVVLVIDRQGRYREVAPTNPGMLVRPPDELLGKSLADFFRPDQVNTFMGVIRQVLETGQTAQIEYDLLIGERSMWFQASISPMTEDSTLWVAHDITRRRRMEEEIRSLSLTDELTGLHNRRGFDLLAMQELKLARRFKRGLLLFFGDMDHLKIVNDTWGHSQGDLALQEMAAILKETFRESDIIARMGGDEFLVLAVDVSMESSDSLSRRLQSTLERHNRAANHPWQLSISLGIAGYDSAAPCSLAELISRADTRMYADKQGRQAARH